jgi:ketosteroid isomerase-like protein
MATETFVINSKTGQASILKDPDAVLDYTFDWTTWLASASDPADEIDSVSAAVSASLTAQVDATFFDINKVTVWVSGGAVGEKIVLRCRINTTGGRTDDRTVYLTVKER